MLKSLISKLLPAPEVQIREKIFLDPHGIGGRQLNAIKKYCGTGKYKVGDPIESVSYRQGQLDLIEFIETKLLAPTSKL